jgi:hypothetical protein
MADAKRSALGGTGPVLSAKELRGLRTDPAERRDAIRRMKTLLWLMDPPRGTKKGSGLVTGRSPEALELRIMKKKQPARQVVRFSP